MRGPEGAAAAQGNNFSAVRGPEGAAAAQGNNFSAVRGPEGAAAAQGNNFSAVRGSEGGAAIQGNNFSAVRGSEGAAAIQGNNFSAVRGPAGNTAVGHFGNTYVNRGQINTVQNNFHGYGSYWSSGWYARYPGAWYAAGVATAAWWSMPAWSVVAPYYGYTGTPYSYDYGTSITYNDNTVYYGTQPVASASQYYQQATDLAESGKQASNEDWMPLGTFALVTEGQTKSDKVVQLAVNKSGIIRGNLVDQISDHVTQLEGAVDKKNQRVAIRPTNGTTVVAECGLWNLTQNTVPLLIHLDKDHNDHRTLIRLTQPKAGGSQ